jgi:hypothetical protein
MDGRVMLFACAFPQKRPRRARCLARMLPRSHPAPAVQGAVQATQQMHTACKRHARKAVFLRDNVNAML